MTNIHLPVLPCCWIVNKIYIKISSFNTCFLFCWGIINYPIFALFQESVPDDAIDRDVDDDDLPPDWQDTEKAHCFKVAVVLR